VHICLRALVYSLSTQQFVHSCNHALHRQHHRHTVPQSYIAAAAAACPATAAVLGLLAAAVEAEGVLGFDLEGEGFDLGEGAVEEEGGGAELGEEGGGGKAVEAGCRGGGGGLIISRR